MLNSRVFYHVLSGRRKPEILFDSEQFKLKVSIGTEYFINLKLQDRVLFIDDIIL